MVLIGSVMTLYNTSSTSPFYSLDLSTYGTANVRRTIDNEHGISKYNRLIPRQQDNPQIYVTLTITTDQCDNPLADQTPSLLCIYSPTIPTLQLDGSTSTFTATNGQYLGSKFASNGDGTYTGV